MIAMPIGHAGNDAEYLVKWRNGSLKALRTSRRTTWIEQEEFVEWCVRNPHKIRMWRFHRDDEELAYEPVAYGGLEHVEWENGLAELTLLVNPTMRRQGNGRAAFRYIMQEAFYKLRLNCVWSETYRCNQDGVAFIESLRSAYGLYTVTIPDRKYYNGKYHEAVWWCMTKERWDEIRSWHPGATG